MAGPGHNSGQVGGIAADKLRSYVERIERLAEERQGLSDDIKDIYTELKAQGYDTATVRRIVALRRKDPQKRREEQELLELYGDALGVFG